MTQPQQFTFNPPNQVMAMFSENPQEIYDWLVSLNIPDLQVILDMSMMSLVVHTIRDGEETVLIDPQYGYVIVHDSGEVHSVPRRTFEAFYSKVD
jgi:hypothetical protein